MNFKGTAGAVALPGKPLRQSTGRAGIALVLASLGLLGPSGCIDDPRPPGDEAPITVQSPLLPGECGATPCPDNTWPGDFFGAWPGGIVYYKMDAASGGPGWATEMRKAMDDWERMTGGAIKFQATTAQSTSFFPVLTIHKTLPNTSESCGGFNSCRSGACDAYMESAAYHELGHCLGYPHLITRSDDRHYVDEYVTPTNTCTNLARSTMPWGQNLLDFGPFDYLSAMFYPYGYPALARWDGSPMMPGTGCNGTGPSIPPQSCTGTFCVPTCTLCRKDQPFGFPSFNDAGGLAEM